MSKFNEILTTVATIVEMTPYDSRWENGTGYFDHLASRPGVETPKDTPGWSIDPHGRRIFWIGGGSRGNLVWFERYADGSGIIASNMPGSVKSLSSGMHELIFDAIHVNGLQRFDEAVELINAIKLIYTHPMGRSIAKAML